MEHDRTASGPLFVVGTPRSGTTLTAQILGRHSTLFMSGENHFFEDIYVKWSPRWPSAGAEERSDIVELLTTIYGRYNQVDDQPRIDALLTRDPGLKDRLAGSATLGEMLDKFMRAQMLGASKHTWGNNTPKDIFHFEGIAACFPDCRFVICVRDPRDFLLSYKGRWRVTTERHKERLASLYHPVLTSMLWRATMRQGRRLRERFPGRFAVVRYEELVTRPDHVVRDLCAKLGITFEPSMLEVETHNSSAPISAKGIFSSSVGRWRGQLSAEELWILEHVSGKDMEAWGYDLTRPRPRLLPLIRILMAFPVRTIKAFRANKANRGPTAPYIAKRLRALFSART
jgi:hypothetical protein